MAGDARRRPSSRRRPTPSASTSSARTLPEMRERALALNSELAETREQRVAAENLAAEAARHVPERARERGSASSSCALELPHASPCWPRRTESSRSRRRSISDAEAAPRAVGGGERVHPPAARTAAARPATHDARARFANAARGWRRRARSAAEQLAALNLEFRHAERTIADLGHLPTRNSQAEQEARALAAQDEAAARRVPPAPPTSFATRRTRTLHEARRAARAVPRAPPDGRRCARGHRSRHRAPLAASLDPLAAELAAAPQQIADGPRRDSQAEPRRPAAASSSSVAASLTTCPRRLPRARRRRSRAAADRGRAEPTSCAARSARAAAAARDDVRTRLRAIEARLPRDRRGARAGRAVS